MAQSDFADLLQRIVDDSRGDLKAIIIFDLAEGLGLHHNAKLKTDNPTLHHALFEDDGGVQETGFDSLNKIQDALNNFGDITYSGELQYSIFKLKEGTMMIYFDSLPDITVAISFLAPNGINLGNVVFQSRRKIEEIKNAIKNL